MADLSIAEATAPLVGQRNALLDLIAKIDTWIANADNEELFQCKSRDKNTGEVHDLLPFGAANSANTSQALQNAKATYQAAVDALTAQIQAL